MIFILPDFWVVLPRAWRPAKGLLSAARATVNMNYAT